MNKRVWNVEIIVKAGGEVVGTVNYEFPMIYGFQESIITAIDYYYEENARGTIPLSTDYTINVYEGPGAGA